MPPPSPPETVVLETVQFAAGPYRLEGELVYPEATAPRGAALLVGPHPLLGGTLHNNVIRGLGDGLAELGIVTLRFNYRGVGRSQGPAVDVAEQLARFWETSHVAGEVDLRDDAAGAARFLRTLVPETLPLISIGYSFGCSLLPHVQSEVPAGAMVLIAPTIGRHAYDAYESVQVPLLVIASEDDFAVDAGQLHRWFEQLQAPRQLVQRRLDNHFFRGHEPWLVRQVAAFYEANGR